MRGISIEWLIAHGKGGAIAKIAYNELAAWTGGRSCRLDRSERKVRTRQDTVVGNTHRPRGQGQCHRKHTADGPACRGTGNGEKVR